MKKSLSLIVLLFIAIGFTRSVIGQSEFNRSLEFDYMDLSVLPKDDFYQFSNGNWMKNNPIPEEESRWSSFNVLADKNINTLSKILLKAVENPGEKESANQLIGDYYSSFIDTISRNEKRVEPILEYMSLIESIENTEDLQNVITFLRFKSFFFITIFSFWNVVFLVNIWYKFTIWFDVKFI